MTAIQRFSHLVFYMRLIPYMRTLLALLKPSFRMQRDWQLHTFYHTCTGKLANTKNSGVIQFAFNDVPANASRKSCGARGIMEDLEYYQGQRANLEKHVGKWKFRSSLTERVTRLLHTLSLSRKSQRRDVRVINLI